MASMYGGQSAASFGQGFSAGIRDMNSLLNAKQSRELRAQEASQKAQMFTRQLTEADNANKQQGFKTEVMQQLSDELKASKAELKQLQGNETKMYNNSYVVAETSEDQKVELDRWKKAMPKTVQQSLGIQNIETARNITTNDFDKVKLYLAKVGADPLALKDEVVNEVINSGLLIEVDGKIQNMSDMTKISGAYSVMNKGEREKFDAKEAKIAQLAKAALEEANINKAVREKQLKENINKREAQILGHSYAGPSDSKPLSVQQQVASEFFSDPANDLSTEEGVAKFNKMMLAASGSKDLLDGEGGSVHEKRLSLRKTLSDPKASTEDKDLARSELNALNKDSKVSKEDANSFLSGQGNRTTIEGIRHGKEEVNSDWVSENLIAERNAGIKVPTDIKKSTTVAVPTYKATAKLVDDGIAAWKELASEGNQSVLVSGLIDSKGASLASILSDETFSKMTAKEQFKYLSSVKFKGRAGTIFSKYVNTISGAAVSEQEFERLAKNFFGGDPDNVNLQTMVTAMAGFNQELGTSITNSAKSNLAAYPGSMGDVLLQVGENKPFDVEQMIEEGGSGDKTIAGASMEGTKDVVADAAGGVGGFFRDIGDKIKDKLSSKPDNSPKPIDLRRTFSKKEVNTIAELPEGQEFSTDVNPEIKYVKRDNKVYRVEGK